MLRPLILKEEPSSLTSPVKFIRLPHLTAELRLKIATIALIFSVHGTVTKLAAQYAVSRTFIYQLRNALGGHAELLFGAGPSPGTHSQELRKQTVRLVLLLRLAGRCGISAISTLLTALGMPFASAGFISQVVQQAGAALSATIEWRGRAVFGCDEIFFMGRHPILITVDVLSGAILHMEKPGALTKQAWVAHWERLREKGIEPFRLTSDEGWIMRAAREDSLGEVPWQPDTFHAISHRLGGSSSASIAKPSMPWHTSMGARTGWRPPKWKKCGKTAGSNGSRRTRLPYRRCACMMTFAFFTIAYWSKTKCPAQRAGPPPHLGGSRSTHSG